MAEREIPTGFGEIDEAAASACARYLDAVAEAAPFRRYKAASRELVAAEPGERVLDVGCGVGTDARLLAARVAPGGRVVAIDRSLALIREARRRGRADDVVYCVGDGHRLPWPDARFDACRAERVLMHVADPGGVVAEMARVTGAGGRVVACEPDWATLVIDVPDRRLTRQVVDAWCDATPNGWIGRRLAGLLRAAGLAEVEADAETVIVTDQALARRLFDLDRAVHGLADAGRITARDADAWLRSLEARDAAGRFFCAVTYFLVRGRKV